MPFDGISYQSAGLSPPIHAHPNAPAVGDVGHDGLVGAYMVARKHAQYVGCTTYRNFARNRFAFTTLPGQFASATMVDVGRVFAGLPAHVTHMGATAHFRVLAAEPAVVRGQLYTSGGAGDVVEVEVPPFADTANVSVGTLGAGSRLAAFVPFFYDTHTMTVSAEVVGDLGLTLPDAGTDFHMRMYAVGNTSGTAVYVRPVYVTFWVWSED